MDFREFAKDRIRLKDGKEMTCQDIVDTIMSSTQDSVPEKKAQDFVSSFYDELDAMDLEDICLAFDDWCYPEYDVDPSKLDEANDPENTDEIFGEIKAQLNRTFRSGRFVEKDGLLDFRGEIDNGVTYYIKARRSGNRFKVVRADIRTSDGKNLSDSAKAYFNIR